MLSRFAFKFNLRRYSKGTMLTYLLKMGDYEVGRCRLKPDETRVESA